jgi:hypothetical protein
MYRRTVRGERQTELQTELRRDALLAPCVVGCRYLRNESLQLSGNAGAPTLTGFQTPEEAKEIAVPPHERIGTHNRQELAPLDESRQDDECDTRRIVSPSRSNLALDVTRELLAEKEVLSRQLRSGPEHQPQQAQQVSEECERRSEHVWR